MVWGYFLPLVGAVSTTAGIVIAVLWEHVCSGAMPDYIVTLLGIGVGVMLLGVLILYAIDPEKYLRKRDE